MQSTRKFLLQSSVVILVGIVLAMVVRRPAMQEDLSWTPPSHFAFTDTLGRRVITESLSNFLTESGFDAITHKAASLHRIDPDLLRAVILVESGFQPGAHSPRGARGPMQLMPDTARYMGVQNINNPIENIRGGSRYLRYLLDRFDGKVELALAAYNAGPEAVRKHNGVPPFAETKTYVRKVMATYRAIQTDRI